ncbi:homing endonuclease associated repeat-containing protein [Natrinema salsiterrestre]|uniref:DEAD/DEAH box helicase family protein n=1 Tax=Natrinema salsiterrestre TaxID=2950540 RepID=A0A9Q4Q0B1_9EURY|nr:DEAD/DEAH box helicase family protein [Natrinema salsiterrestre]MDF9746295.1 DEAD/DEAH box helicase family protein [Natrinema salsiterrestre]
MAGLVEYDYDFFEDYQSKVLSDLPSIEQLIRLDDEVANKVTMARYEGPVDPIEWNDLERYYSDLFADFVTERIQGVVDTEPIETNRDRFHTFRRHVASLNKNLPAQRTAQTSVISKPAETVLLKRLRQLGFDPSALDITHIGRGGGLYLLELFVTAAQQQALSDTELLTALLEEASSLGSLGREEAMARLHNPVLMVSLWDNQQAGLDNWLTNGRHGILEMATATGKTVAGIAAIAECCGVLPNDPNHSPRTTDANIMVVAHSNAILKQWEREIQEKLGLPMPAGKTGDKADRLSFNGGEVEFYTAQSLLPRYDRDLENKYDLVIYDEVHHYSNIDGYGAAIDRPNYESAMGLSATIGDEGGLKREQLTELLGDVVYTYGVEDARRDGIIPDFDWTVHPTPLDPYEREEWEETTESISDQFKHIRRSSETERILKRIPVPFTELEDLGDFIRAHEAASMALDDDQIPDDWSNLQATIHSRTWIRHRSQPKIEGAIELAEEYLSDPDQPVKVVIFAMDIDTADRIADTLSDVTDNVYRAHSQLESSSRKNNERVQQNIDAFANCDNGVLVSPKMLDEGIDVPDAEVGINVAGTKTKLQLVQRMGRVLRKHGDQRPHFHHFIAVPDENYIAGLDSKEYVQELNWVRELGETIGVQPVIEEAGVDADLLERAKQRGHELWARDLLDDLEIETVQGNVHLDQLLEELTAEAIEILLDELWLGGEYVAQDDWETAMDRLRDDEALTVEGLQRVWWLFPLYRERPEELEDLLTASFEALSEEDVPTTRKGRDSDNSDQESTNADDGRVETSSTERDNQSSSSEDEGQPRVSGEPTEAGDSESSNEKSTSATKAAELQVPVPQSVDILEEFGVQKSAIELDANRITQDAQQSVDDELLTGIGSGGLLSSGYLYQRSLATYLYEDEQPQYLLASEDRSPALYISTDLERSLPNLDGYQAITAITPTRALCVVGSEPENVPVQLRYEDLTKVEIEQSGQLFWKKSSLVLRTDDQRLTIPDETGTDLKAVAEYICAAAYQQKHAAGLRLLDACNSVLATGEVDRLGSVLEMAREQLQYAIHWGNSHDLDTESSRRALELVDTCVGQFDTKRDVLRLWGEVQRILVDARLTSLDNDDRLEELCTTAQTKLDKLLSGSVRGSQYLQTEATRLQNSLEVALPSDEDSNTDTAEDETSEPPEGSSKSSERKPKRQRLLDELQALTEELGAVPKAPEMDEQGTYSTHEYYQTFGSWDDALDAAGLDKRAALIDELERVATELGEIPSTTQVDEHGRYSSGMYSNEFGTFTEARDVANFEFLEEEPSREGESQSETEQDEDRATENPDAEPAREALIAEIQRLDRSTEELLPYASEMDSRGEFTAYGCQREFGSWDDALDAAGIDKRERLLEELRRVRDEVERIPKTTDMDNHGRVSASMYSNFFGSWTEATSLIEDATLSASGKGDSTTTSEGDTLDENDEDVLTWEDIPGNSRLPGPIPIQIVEKRTARSDRVDGRYLVRDLAGTEFELKVWAKHGITVDWEPGCWYVLSEARGTVWESDGEVNRMLDSTRDLETVECLSRPTKQDLL